jgi:hypothetical protein
MVRRVLQKIPVHTLPSLVWDSLFQGQGKPHRRVTQKAGGRPSLPQERPLQTSGQASATKCDCNGERLGETNLRSRIKVESLSFKWSANFGIHAFVHEGPMRSAIFTKLGVPGHDSGVREIVDRFHVDLLSVLFLVRIVAPGFALDS